MSTDKQVIWVIDNDAIFRQPWDREGLAPCSHAEADSGMMAHIADAANTYNSILTGTMDSNIVVGCVRVWRTDLITKLPVARWLLTLAIITH